MSAADILAQPLCAFAFCWRLERRDGVTIGLTSHDRPLTIDGLAYAPTPGISPSAILRGGDARAERTEVRGALSSAALSGADLDMGRWDGAAARLHLTEWTDPGVLWLELARGALGSVEQIGQGYSVALHGLGTLLDQPVAPATSPTCRACLGDRACTVDLRAHQSIAAVVSIADDAVSFSGLGAGLYPFGRIRWLTGTSAGITQMILHQEEDVLILAEPPALPIVAGTLALVTQGCDKRLATCAGRFGNAVNFRGEPFLPGIDLLTRYPGA
jgi:uncharacterized phage protein (TIGR02218 family)